MENSEALPRKDLLKIGAIAAGSALIPKVGTLALKAHEQLSSHYPTITLEPGGHFADSKKHFEELQAGNINAHSWDNNPELKKRISRYKPQIVSVEGLSLRDFEPEDLWFLLPDRPRNINPLGVYLITGDTSYAKFYSHIAYGNKEKVQQELAKEGFSNIPSSPKSENNTQNEALAIAGGVLALIAARTEIPPELSTDKGISRRNLFRKAVVAFGATAAMQGLTQKGVDLLGHDADKKAAWSNTGFWQTIDAAFNERDDVWLDGRTALMIAKHLDGTEFLEKNGYLKTEQKPKGSIIMGYSHTQKGNIFMHDKEARDKAIYEYAKSTLGAVNKVADKYLSLSDEQRHQMQESVLLHFATASITRCSDPGRPLNLKSKDYIETNIHKVSTIRSKQVMDAVESLRPKAIPFKD